MAGTVTNSFPVVDVVHGYSNAAVTANQYLTEFIVPMRGARIGAIKATGATAGSGTGNTVIDILKNGTSIFATAANRPTLAAASTGEFTNLEPDGGTPTGRAKALVPGDVIAIQVVTVPSVAGHARVACDVTLQLGR